MPFVSSAEGLNRPFCDLEGAAREMGPPPWRVALVGTPALRVVLLMWPPGYATVSHVHPAAEEIFMVLHGRALFTIGSETERSVEPGELILAPRGVLHAIRVPDGPPLTLLAAVAPNQDISDETIEFPS